MSLTQETLCGLIYRFCKPEVAVVNYMSWQQDKDGTVAAIRAGVPEALQWIGDTCRISRDMIIHRDGAHVAAKTMTLVKDPANRAFPPEFLARLVAEVASTNPATIVFVDIARTSWTAERFVAAVKQDADLAAGYSAAFAGTIAQLLQSLKTRMPRKAIQENIGEASGLKP